MPFLARCTDNWISSLRGGGNKGKSDTGRTKYTTETSKESGEVTQREGEELPNFAFFLNKF